MSYELKEGQSVIYIGNHQQSLGKGRRYEIKEVGEDNTSVLITNDVGEGIWLKNSEYQSIGRF